MNFNVCLPNCSSRLILLLGFFVATNSLAALPIAKDVDVYASLCKIGTEKTVSASASASSELSFISRRLLAGEAKLSASKLQDEFPGIHDEKNRLLALQSFQDCMYRYVDRFHPRLPSDQPAIQAAIAPTVSSERRREIVYLANELDSFKQKMSKAVARVPEEFYDKRDSTDKRPKDDPRLIGLANYSRYKSFESASGGLDFSNLTNNDIAILCNTYTAEINDYTAFVYQYQPLGLTPYAATREVRRICTAAERGR